MFLANLFAQMGIVVTGGLVRVTGSGLGCPTWPECVAGSLVPTASQGAAWHKYVEFGNRTLTVVLLVLAVLAVLAARRTDRVSVRRLALVPLAGTFAQALLGGVTVLTGLSPYWVGAHLLLSMAIIAGCAVLCRRAGEPGDEPRRLLVRPELVLYAKVLVAATALVVAMGTVVTGAGPHSGDLEASHRLPVDPRVVAWLHADAVLLFLGLLGGMWLALRLTSGPPAALRWVRIVLGASVLQGVVGYTQWSTGLPWWLVAVHITLATVVWVAVWQLLLSLRTRGQIGA